MTIMLLQKAGEVPLANVGMVVGLVSWITARAAVQGSYAGTVSWQIVLSLGAWILVEWLIAQLLG